MRNIVQKTYSKAPGSEAQVVYRRAALERVNQQHALEQSARKAAKRIVEEAGRHAQTCYEQARFEGYRDGIALFVDVLIDQAVNLSQTFASRLDREREAIAQDVRNLFEDAQTARALIEEYLGAEDADCDRQVTVHVPRWCRLSQSAIADLRENSGRRIALASSPSDCFVISNGQFSISFAPLSASAEVCMRAAHRNLQDLPDAAADIVEALLSRIQQTRGSSPE